LAPRLSHQRRSWPGWKGATLGDSASVRARRGISNSAGGIVRFGLARWKDRGEPLRPLASATKNMDVTEAQLNRGRRWVPCSKPFDRTAPRSTGFGLRRPRCGLGPARPPPPGLGPPGRQDTGNRGCFAVLGGKAVASALTLKLPRNTANAYGPRTVKQLIARACNPYPAGLIIGQQNVGEQIAGARIAPGSRKKTGPRRRLPPPGSTKP